MGRTTGTIEPKGRGSEQIDELWDLENDNQPGNCPRKPIVDHDCKEFLLLVPAELGRWSSLLVGNVGPTEAD